MDKNCLTLVNTYTNVARGKLSKKFRTRKVKVCGCVCVCLSLSFSFSLGFTTYNREGYVGKFCICIKSHSKEGQSPCLCNLGNWRPKLPKCVPIAVPKLRHLLSVCVVVVSSFRAWLLPDIVMLSRSSMYVKANDAWYGLKVASRDPKTSKVLGL
jgi:hypothetical protein